MNRPKRRVTIQIDLEVVKSVSDKVVRESARRLGIALPGVLADTAFEFDRAHSPINGGVRSEIVVETTIDKGEQT